MEASRLELPGGGQFDTLAPAYDAWYDTPLGRVVDRLESGAVLGLVGEGPGAWALDLSCGTGRYALALARRGLRVVGVDISEPMLLVARAKAREAGCDLRLVRADPRALAFRAGAVVLVTIIRGLEFVGEPRGVLEGCHRVLVPGGSLVIAILSRGGLWTVWRRLKRLVVPSVWGGATFLSPAELGDLLRARGFTGLRWRGAVHFLPLLGRRRVG